MRLGYPERAHLNSRLVSSEDSEWLHRTGAIAPHAGHVVVPAAGQPRSVGRPVQPAHLQSVVAVACHAVVRYPDVMVVDLRVLTPAGECV